MDYRLEQWVNGPAGSHPLVDAVMSFASGQAAAIFIALVVTWLLYGILRSSAAEEAGASLAALAAGAGFGVNQVLAVIWNRPRPFTAHPSTVHLLVKHVADSSFPSDHAAAGFAIALVLALRHRRLGAVALGFAVVMSYARVYVGNHYPGDVAAGMLVGVLAALLATAATGRLLLRPWSALPRIGPRSWRERSPRG